MNNSNSSKGVNLFERNPQLLESISLIQRKKLAEQDWFDKEVNTWFFPAQQMSKLNHRPDIFDKRSATAIALSILLVIPAIALAPFWIQSFRRRAKKVEQMRDIQFRLSSILPARLNTSRGDFVPRQYEEYLPDLMEEGIVFENVVSNLELSMMEHNLH